MELTRMESPHGRSKVPVPDLPVVAEGDGPGGERWFLKAGGSPDDYGTMLETVRPDGHRDEGGMGGPALYPGQPLNSYAGRADQGPLRIIVRADPRVQRLRLRSALGDDRYLLACAHDPAVRLNFFAALLPWTADITGLDGLDAGGQVVT
jgi:hypothetical protein